MAQIEAEGTKQAISEGPKTNVTVKLIGKNGNAFYIIGKVIKALWKAGYDDEFIKTFREEAMSGNHDHLLQTVMKYVEVE